MVEDAPLQRSAATDDAAKAGVGMDKAPFRRRDQQVVLAWLDANQQDIARCNRTACRDQGAACGETGQVGKDARAKRIPIGQMRWPAAPFQRCSEQADAIDARCGIASVQAERSADQRFGRCGQFCAGRHAAVDGGGGKR